VTSFEELGGRCTRAMAIRGGKSAVVGLFILHQEVGKMPIR